MKAVVVQAPGKAEIKVLPMPDVGAKDVLIKVSYCGICGTDFSIYSGKTSLVSDGLIKYPVRIGHEFSGVVERAGQEVKSFRPGDRVVCDTMVSCGSCTECTRHNYHSCKAFYSIGTVNCWDGAFAEYIVIPEYNVYHLPDPVSLEEAALIEPAAIAYNAVVASPIRRDSRVLVIGTGCIGLSAVALVKTLYGATVFLSGRKDIKLECGRMMGADATINITKEDIRERINELTEGSGVDVIIDTAGSVSATKESLYLARSGAFIALIGFFEMPLDGFNIDRFVLRQIRMHGIAGCFGTPPKIAALLAEKRISLMPLITQNLRLDDMPDALAARHENRADVIKMMVRI